MTINNLKTKLGKFLSRIGNKLQNKPNLVSLHQDTLPIINYDIDKFELCRAQMEISAQTLLDFSNEPDFFQEQIINKGLAKELSNKIIERYKQDIKIHSKEDGNLQYSLQVLVSKPQSS